MGKFSKFNNVASLIEKGLQLKLDKPDKVLKRRKLINDGVDLFINGGKSLVKALNIMSDRLKNKMQDRLDDVIGTLPLEWADKKDR